MIEVKDLNYKVKTKDGERSILSSFSYSFEDDKITVITGQNGSGKSTLLKILMGIIKQESGHIYYNNHEITAKDITSRANMGFTYAFQQPIKFKGLKVKDMLEIAKGEVLTISKACEYLSIVGLCAKNYIDREFDSTLSGGELKRIELSMALCKGGDVFLFDEPESGIDLWSFDELVKIFKNIKNKIIIIVSHQKQILEIADNILILDQNNPPKFGTKSEMANFVNSNTCSVLKGANNG